MPAKTIPEAEAAELCKASKKGDPPDSSWASGDNPGSQEMAFGLVCTPPRRGLVVQLYVSRGQKVPRKKMDLGLWDNSSGVSERIYQLTVADSNLHLHTEAGEKWYGSHEHIGLKAIHRQDMDDWDFPQALGYFCEKINLQLEADIDDPFVLSLT